MNAHIRQAEQQEKFGQSVEGLLEDQVVVLRLKNATDVRGWYLNDVLDEVDVELVGWASYGDVTEEEL